MAADSTYNGWKNYPTWNVNLWLSNDEGLYRYTLELTTEALGDAEAKGVGAGRGDVAQRIKTFVVDDLAPDLGASFAADLLGYALDQVDWLEIADAWIESAQDVSAEVDC